MRFRGGPGAAHRYDERGAAAVFGIALVGLLVCFTVACCVVASVVSGHRRAESAADLAALAAARALQEGTDGCTDAARIASANGARIETCRVDGLDVVVTVRVAAARLFGAGLTLPARARAGRGAG
ncbi:Rv3654c family TadE-like protein [Nocardioides terrisoli]|uniref:Rv3654c family TadE-like protein n=1 Tax=Nocardioides terrisoli TaxID=3388267 RepID=UPI00287B80DD|nr:Rv3654c family TadE-like protein [Nocardioides marmorisolisilvae]